MLLEPRSLLILQGDSRYLYRHGIRRSRLVHTPQGVLRRGPDYVPRHRFGFRGPKTLGFGPKSPQKGLKTGRKSAAAPWFRARIRSESP